MPQQFVKVPRLTVLLPVDNCRMFFRCDSSLLFEYRPGPLQAWNDGFQQPFHAEGVIVNPSQINIRGHFAIGQRTVEMFRSCFRHAQVADAVKVFIFDCRVPTSACSIRFLGNDVFHHFLPRPGGQFGISTVEIHSCQRKVKVRLTLRFVVCLKDALCFVFITRFEALLFAGDFVFEVEDASGTPDQTECLFHCFTHDYDCAGIGTCRVSEQWAGYS